MPGPAPEVLTGARRLSQRGKATPFACLTLTLVSGLMAHGLAITGKERTFAPAVGEQKPQSSTANKADTTHAVALESGKPLERELKGGASHAYSITLKAGQFMRIVVEQKGIDVVLLLTDENGKQLLEVDAPNGSFGPESISFETPSSQSFQITVRALGNEGSGKYSVTAEIHPSASTQDRIRLTAEQTFRSARVQYQQLKPESVTEAVKGYELAANSWHSLNDQYWESVALANAGLAYSALGNTKAALEQFSKARLLQQAVKDQHGESDTLSLIGTTYLLAENYQKALESLNEALTLKRALVDRGGEVAVLRNISRVHGRLSDDYYYQSMSTKERNDYWNGEASRAMRDEKYDQAIQFAKKAVEVESSPSNISMLALTYQAAHRFEDALKVINDWQSKFGEQETFRDLIARSNYLLAEELSEKGLLSEAVKHYQAAVAVDRFVTGRAPLIRFNTEPNGYSLLTVFDQDSGSFDQELAVLPFPASSLKYSQGSDGARWTLRTEPATAGIFNANKTLSPDESVLNVREREQVAYEALPTNIEAQKVFKTLEQRLAQAKADNDPPSVAETLLKEAFTYALFAEFAPHQVDVSPELLDESNESVKIQWQRKAAALGKDTLELKRRLKDRRGEANLLNSLGVLHTTMQKFAEAAVYYEQALSITRELKDRKGEARVLVNIGANAIAQSRSEEAMGSFLEARRIAEELGERKLAGIALQYNGTANASRKNFESSLKDFTAALEIAQSTNQRDAQARILNSLGIVLVAVNRPDDALRSHEKALALARDTKNRSLEWSSLCHLALVQASLGNNQEAIRNYKTAGQVSQRAMLSSFGSAVLYSNVGALYQSLGRNDVALDYYDRALREGVDSDARFATLLNIAVIKVTERKYADAVGAYEESLAAARSAKDQKHELAALMGLGRANYLQQHYDEAIKSYELALSLVGDEDRALVDAPTLISLAAAYEAIDRHAEAIDRLNQALVLATRAKAERELGDILNNLGLVHTYLGQNEKAISLYQQSLALRRRLADSDGEAFTLNNLAFSYSQLGQTPRAVALYQRALVIERARKDRIAEGRTLGNLAELTATNGQFAAAIQYADQSLALARQEKDRGGEGSTLYKLGWIYLRQQQFEKSAGYFADSLVIFRELKALARQGMSLSGLMLTSKSLGRSEQAAFYGKQAVNAYQTVRANLTSLDKELRQSFVSSKEKTYRELADILISQNRLPEAQQVLGMLKEEEYFEFIRRDAGSVSALTARASLTSEEAELEKEYLKLADDIARLARERGQLFAKVNRAVVEDKRLEKLDEDLSLALDHFHKFLEQLQVKLGTNSASAARVMEVKDALGMKKTLRELGPGTVVLYTLVAEDKYRMMLVTPDLEQAYENPITASALQRKVLEFRLALEDPGVDPAPLARELYQILIGPKLAHDLKEVGATTLMWSLDGVLRYLPVAALQDEQRKYLVESYRNVIFTPASRDRLKDNVNEHWTGLGLGVSKASPDFSELPGVQQELRAIIRDQAAPLADGEGVLVGKVLLNEGFTRDSMKAALRQHYQLVHIASHFRFRPGGDENDSFLLLGDKEQQKSRLTLAEIRTLNFEGVDLLTLSACETAMGDTRANGIEVESFGVLAQRQGAEAVMATLWPVADVSTPLFMREFYRVREANTGMVKVEALRRAQLSLLQGTAAQMQLDQNHKRAQLFSQPLKGSSAQPLFKANPKAPFAHPYYWAPFILIGNWR
jgi:CHAT domain-containing protein/uncharacterized protein HemY